MTTPAHAESLITWPRDDRFTTTCEGMFAYLVVLGEQPDARPDACRVDVHVHLTEPDVRVPFRMAEPQLWDGTDYHDRGRTKLHAARAALERAGEPGHSAALKDLVGRDELSLPLRAAVLLGSTDLAPVWATGTGGYWEPTADDLTPDGRALYDLLARIYGARPHIITFLDT
ncbi:hypothetical protein [Streptomyces longwoodensis]|uniref:hypothetical protein n=1 Tax=Streptomyces longwoodensis TaxID=68231 RepID=UPI0036FD9E61